MDDERRDAILQDLADRTEIYDCVKRFCRGMDRLDRELMMSAFHEDAVDDHVVICDTPEKFTDWAIGMHSLNHRSTTHLLSNHSVEIDGDQAHSETYVTLVGELRDPSQPLQFIGARYVDRFERRDDVWRISARVCLVTFVSELPQCGTDESWEQLRSTGGMFARDRSDISYMRPLVTRSPGAIGVDDIPDMPTIDPRSAAAP